jgi:hypothetical protein
MMRYEEKCKLDHTMPLNNPCTHYNTHLATLVIINLCTVMMSQSGDITKDSIQKLVIVQGLVSEWYELPMGGCQLLFLQVKP